MPVYFENDLGNIVILSPALLKKELMQLENTRLPVYENLDLDGAGDELLSVLLKMDFDIDKVTTEELIEQLERLEDLEVSGFMFSLNRVHYLALTYLLKEGYISQKEIKDILNARFKTRNQLLIEKMDIEGASFSFALNFMKTIKTGMSSPAIAYGLNESDFKYFRYIQLSATYIDPVRITIFFHLKDISKFNLFYDYLDLVNSVYGFNDFSYSSNAYNDYKLANSKNLREYFASTGFGGLINLLIEFIPLVRLIDDIIEFVKSWAFGARGFIEALENYKTLNDSKSYLELLTKKYDNTKIFPKKTVDTKNFYKSYFNKYYADLILKSYFTEKSLRNKNTVANLFSSTMQGNQNRIADHIKNSSSYAFKIADGNTPIYVSYFDHLSWAYKHNSYWVKNFDYNTFDRNSGTFYNDLENGYDFSYLNSEEDIKDFVSSLFPESTNLLRSDEDYILKYFLNQLDAFEYKKENNSPYFSFSETVSTSFSKANENSKEIIFKINQLLDFDFVIDDTSGKVLRIGSNIKKYIDDSFSAALSENGITGDEINTIDSYDGPNGVLTFITKLKTDLLISINNQTGSDTFILFKPFLKDIVSNYLDYLVNNNLAKDQIVYTISPANIKIYRVLNFIKHTFINFKNTLEYLSDQRETKDFLIMVLSSKILPTKETIENLYLDDSSIEDILNTLVK